jgi:hypothetical protein
MSDGWDSSSKKTLALCLRIFRSLAQKRPLSRMTSTLLGSDAACLRGANNPLEVLATYIVTVQVLKCCMMMKMQRNIDADGRDSIVLNSVLQEEHIRIHPK